MCRKQIAGEIGGKTVTPIKVGSVSYREELDTLLAKTAPDRLVCIAILAPWCGDVLEVSTNVRKLANSLQTTDDRGPLFLLHQLNSDSFMREEFNVATLPAYACFMGKRLVQLATGMVGYDDIRRMVWRARSSCTIVCVLHVLCCVSHVWGVSFC